MTPPHICCSIHIRKTKQTYLGILHNLAILSWALPLISSSKNIFFLVLVYIYLVWSGQQRKSFPNAKCKSIFLSLDILYILIKRPITNCVNVKTDHFKCVYGRQVYAWVAYYLFVRCFNAYTWKVLPELGMNLLLKLSFRPSAKYRILSSIVNFKTIFWWKKT